MSNGKNERKGSDPLYSWKNQTKIWAAISNNKQRKQMDINGLDPREAVATLSKFYCILIIYIEKYHIYILQPR